MKYQSKAKRRLRSFACSGAKPRVEHPKSPSQRPTSSKLLTHQFVTRNRSPNVLIDLIQRTKAAVRDLDNLNYRKMKKILMIENCETESTIDVDDTPDEVTGGDSSKSNSVTSEHSVHSVGVSASSQSSSTNSLPAGGDDGAMRRHRPLNHAAAAAVSDHGTNNFATIRTTSIVTKQQKEHMQEEMHEQMSGYKRMRREHQSALLKLEDKCKMEMESHKNQLDKEYEALLQNFSKELERLQLKHQQELERKQKQHQAAEKKLIKDITSRQDSDRKAFDAHRKKEYKANKERWKRELSQDDSTPKRQRDATLQTHKDNLKLVDAQEEQRLLRCQKEFLDLEVRKFRRKKLIAFHQLEQDLLRQELNKRQHQLEQAHAMLLRHHEKTQELEYRQQKAVHALREEQHWFCCNGNLGCNFVRIYDVSLLDGGNILYFLLLPFFFCGIGFGVFLVPFHVLHLVFELVDGLLCGVPGESHQDKVAHVKNQHDTELANQEEYMHRTERELRKKHALELKQQPKSLKQKEMMVRKQFRETCKVQTKQYKALKAQILLTTPKENQKAVIKKLKEEQRRKLALLGDQYEQSIAEMLQKQSIKLDESQELECQRMKERLRYELEILIAYQSKNKMQAQAQRDREKNELQERVSVRRALLEQKMHAENQRFIEERGERIRILHERQDRELEEFDEESVRLGFSALAIAEMSLAINDMPRDGYDDDASLSGSMLSLAHSNSSTSFPPGSV
ncbi:hypothetical protein NQ315_007415 [Exocentrus adspersus]|uniref:non-specific serine/threonine protein kinase n=1 Tax=Exocentrus adspersus TaxID=1586481 RepID=A0AAV8VHL9_9CUCU|nr:hypothetical protein NQ315_007415 [Exocentrus adspersus]